MHPAIARESAAYTVEEMEYHSDAGKIDFKLFGQRSDQCDSLYR
jgi:hypothetical protein